jgi:predicted Co/Zn/Cd cation transporter (cation efflux family)
MRPQPAPVRENIMVRTELRIVLATLATFTVLAGVAVCIQGLLFDQMRVIFSGVVVIVAAVATFVAMLNLRPKDDSKDDS